MFKYLPLIFTDFPTFLQLSNILLIIRVLSLGLYIIKKTVIDMAPALAQRFVGTSQ
jgi:hypothetical protein